MSVLLKIFFSLTLSLTVFAQSVIYDSGLCYMRKFRQVCICNHNSKREIHKQTNKSDCHDPHKTIHVCKCKKQKNPNELSNLLKQTFIFWNFTNFVSIRLTKFIPDFSTHKINLTGFEITLIKPPRLS